MNYDPTLDPKYQYLLRLPRLFTAKDKPVAREVKDLLSGYNPFAKLIDASLAPHKVPARFLK